MIFMLRISNQVFNFSYSNRYLKVQICIADTRLRRILTTVTKFNCNLILTTVTKFNCNLIHQTFNVQTATLLLISEVKESRKIMQFQLYLYILKSSGKSKGEWTGWSPGPVLTSLYSKDWSRVVIERVDGHAEPIFKRPHNSDYKFSKKNSQIQDFLLQTFSSRFNLFVICLTHSYCSLIF